ncbi:hypothetical protein Catovirus_1_354 [Catovirus CTV1]|uniref:Uncharacterized protein n=1 Tax=Catovirus CTV1 TaxID=1977631 RepID=A0A1V0S9E8_9VIRU|nr:hypothetical protein Catovirus_1_354 [Catovirus CTV1]
MNKVLLIGFIILIVYFLTKLLNMEYFEGNQILKKNCKSCY